MLTTLVLLASLSIQTTSTAAMDSIPGGPDEPVAPAPVSLQAREAALPWPREATLLGPNAAEAALTAPLGTQPRLTVASDPAQLVEYSDAYLTRLTIHRWASYLTLPLFAGEYVVGRRLQNGHGSHGLLRLHRGLAAGIGGLFVVNTITGGLNLLEARKDPEGRNRRTLHSVLMLLSDAGFVATGLLANTRRNANGLYRGPATSHAHRNMAIASMATAMVGYAIMLPPFRKE